MKYLHRIRYSTVPVLDFDVSGNETRRNSTSDHVKAFADEKVRRPITVLMEGNESYETNSRRIKKPSDASIRNLYNLSDFQDKSKWLKRF